MNTPVLDLYALSEDERIKVVGEVAVTNITGIMLEKNEPKKIKRYIEKITKRFPTVRYIDTTDVPNTRNLVVLVRFGPKLDA